MNASATVIQTKCGKILVGILVFLTIVFLLLMCQPDWEWWQPEQLKAIIVSLGIWGPLAYIALLVISVVISQIPGAPLAVLAGTIWPPFWAAIYTVMGGFAGAAIAYGLGRTLGTQFIHKLIGRPLQLDLSKTEAHLVRFIFLSRLVPVVPFDLLSYGAGISQVSWTRYAFATLLGMLPSTFLLAYGATLNLSVMPALFHGHL